MEESGADAGIRRFVRELDALQRQRDNRVTLEEIVEAMARAEVTPAGVAEILRATYYEGIAHTGTSPNPADYNRPLILLWLNREHAIVRAVLANEPLPKKPPYIPDPCTRNFQPIKIDGPPLSDDIIRDRR